VYALPVTETVVADEAQASQSGTLDNPPFDPRVNDEHTITVTDEGGGTLDVNLVDDAPESAPATADTVDVYPPTGEYYADSGPDGSEYQFSYTYGDYSADAMQPMLSESPRIIGLCSEREADATTLATGMNTRATAFDFMQAVSGAEINISDPSTYSHSLAQRRQSILYPARGFTDDAETNEVRTVGAVAGYLASLPLGLSSTQDAVGGFSGLKNDLSTELDAGDLIDANVMPLYDYPPTTIIKDMTTAGEAKFERVYANQIADEVTELSHEINRQYLGEQNRIGNRQALRRAHANAFLDLTTGSPRLLDGFTVSVTEAAGDDTEADVEIGIDIVDVMDTIDVSIVVGDIIRNEGAQ
jgi:hypothetical protein